MSITAQRITVTRASGSCGAEVAGLDFRGGIDAATIAELRRIWLDHGVLFLRDVMLPPREFLAFAAQFGTPSNTPSCAGSRASRRSRPW